MSLATRCIACGTLFRVVQDQLRVSEGWVRCGRCDTVFNALDALVDLEAEALAARTVAPDPAPSDAAFYGPADSDTEDGPHAHAGTDPARDAFPTPSDRVSEPNWTSTDTAEPEPDPAWPPAADRLAAENADRQEPVLPTIGAVHAPLLRPELTAARSTAEVAADGAARPGAGVTPGFVRRAEREARWGSPAMRAALVGSALILLAVLGLQAAYHFRDALAARSAVADGLLRSACLRWGCRVEAPRRIQDVALEGSGLSRIAQQPQAVKLSINLRNRGNTDLVMPSVDLSLTDAQGQLIARRTLGPVDFRIDPPVIRRGAELPLELVLTAGERSISGYTVELFYP